MIIMIYMVYVKIAYKTCIIQHDSAFNLQLEIYMRYFRQIVLLGTSPYYSNIYLGYNKIIIIIICIIICIKNNYKNIIF
jgi:hypothetical protein